MDGAPLQSRPFRHGPSVSGPPSPDSACDNDDWTPMTHEEGRTTTSRPRRRCGGDGRAAKSLAGQDSDVDSGIVTCRTSGQRIGSTSSADTDSSQESRRRIEYSPPIQKSELSKSRCYAGSLRIPRRSTCLAPPCGPVKGDHSALKECNRRPPTPLTVFPDFHHCVRFDEQLQLSEQNIRRSCRKLFATLYAQRFSYPSRQEHSLHHSRMHSGSTRSRSRTVPELELRQYSALVGDGQQQHKYVRSCKENLCPVEGRSGSFSSSSRLAYKSKSDATTKVPHMQSFRFPTHPRLSMDQSEDGTSHSNSTDSGLGSSRSSTQCTCQERHSSVLPSSQSTNISIECTCRCCNCNQGLSKSQDSPSKLFKSSSCSTLSSVLSHQSRPQLTQFPPRVLRKVVSHNEDRTKVAPLHKTSSCSNLLDRTVNGFQVANVPVYNDNMMQVYAHIASVIPEDHQKSAASPSQSSSRRSKTLGRIRYTTDNVYDALWQSNCNRQTSSEQPETPRVVGRRVSSLSSGNDTCLRTNIPEMTTFKPMVTPKSIDEVVNDTDNKSIHSVEIYSQIPDRVVESFERKSLRESVQSRNSVMQRPKSVGVVIPNCGPNPVYLKSALKKPTQSAILHVGETTVKAQIVKPCEVEYAVVDKSKKNRFTSLPALNGSNGTFNPAENEEKDPPIPPKKMLHKSDFSLYRSRSSSPKKSLRERMQTLTKNARTALQKAFSSERIYRPEKEERLEASRGLGRSRSFIKGITGSFRKKRRKKESATTDATVPEIVPQASSNPEWDEQMLGPNSPIHVRGQLLQLNIDGSQVVELAKTPSKPYGFFVARGRVRNSKGVFVSRMRDQETKKQLSGLLEIGDEILEINGFDVKEADIMEVNQLMANKNSLLLTVLPYLCRKDV